MGRVMAIAVAMARVMATVRAAVTARVMIILLWSGYGQDRVTVVGLW